MSLSCAATNCRRTRFALEGFNEILANFYREAKIDQLWQFYQPDYERGVEAYRAPVSDLFSRCRIIFAKLSGRAVRRSFFRVRRTARRRQDRISEIMAIITSWSSAPAPIRRWTRFAMPSCISFSIPSPSGTGSQASRASPLLEYAARAPLLPVDMRDDYSGFFDECLVRAVELRLRHLSPAALASAIDQAESSGYVLVRPIYAGLSGFEKSEPAMGYYLPDLVKGIDVAAETTAAARREIRGCGAVRRFGFARKHLARRFQAGRLCRSRGRAIWPKGSAKFPRATAPRPRRLSNAFWRLIRTICARPTAWPWPPRFMGQPDRARELFAKVIAAAPESPRRARCTTGSVESFLVAYLSRKNVRCRRAAGPRRCRISRGSGRGRERRNRRVPPRSAASRQAIRRRRATPSRTASRRFFRAFQSRNGSTRRKRRKRHAIHSEQFFHLRELFQRRRLIS